MNQNPQADGGESKEVSPKGYTFGVELEYRLKLSKDGHKHPGPQKVRDHLANLWNQAGSGIYGHIPRESGYPFQTPREYKSWSIVDEHAMNTGSDFKFCGVEFVSPVFAYSEHDFWGNEIKKLSDFTLKHSDVQMDNSTGFHIHVAPLNRPWSLLELQHISDAVLHFHEPLKELFPDHSYTQAFLKSNITNNPSFSNLPPDKSYSALIHDTQTTEELIDLINPPTSPNNDFSRRYYAWNFTNNSERKSVCLYPKHTVEFRLPRSTTGHDIIDKWIAFTVTFLQASVTSPDNIHFEFAPTIDGLNGFLYHNRPPGGTDDYCWERFLSEDEINRVLQDVGHHTV